MKAIILGDSKTGKTTWAHQACGTTPTTSSSTLGFEVHNLEFNGREFELWDIGYGGIRDAYFIDAKCAFILYNDQSEVDKYKREILRVLGKKIPFVAFNLNELADPEEPLRRMCK